MSVITLANGQYVPTHWNELEYEATCPKCGVEVSAKTNVELVKSLDTHC